MRLIKCNISGYGQFKDTEIDFSKGLNSYCYENGWGKSTLCSFIKVMLYGFDDEGKTSVLNERTHYLPWNSNVYGGSLTIEVDGKKYEIKKEFQAKKNTCNFSLFDADTGLESTDYSEKIGEEILGIDMESFKRTLFISQTNNEYKTTDTINSRIGNIVDNTDDMNTFEIIDDTLKDALNKCSNTRVTGKLYKMNVELSELKVSMAPKEMLEKQSGDIISLIAEKKDLIKLKESEQKKLSESLKEIGEYKDKAAKKAKYEAILKSYEERKETFDELTNFFKKGVPEKEDIENNIRLISNLNALEAKRDNLMSYLSSEEAGEAKDESIRLEELGSLYEGKVIEDVEFSSIIEDWRLAKDDEYKVQALTAEKSSYENEDNEKYDSCEKKKKQKSTVCLVMAVISAVLSGLFMAAALLDISSILGKGTALIIGIVAAVIAATMFISFISIKNKKIIIKPNPKIEILEQEISNKEEFYINSENRISGYIQSFGRDFNQKTAIEDMLMIKHDMQEYAALKKRTAKEIELLNDKKGKYEETVKEIEAVHQSVSAFLDRIGMEPAGDLLLQFHSIKNKADIYDAEKTQFESVANEKAQFEKECEGYEELLSLEAPNDDRTVAELEDKVIGISNEQRALDKELKELETELDEIKSKLTGIVNASEKYDELKECYDEGIHRYDIVNKAKKYLQTAKTNLITKYTKPVKDAFDGFYKELTALDDNEYALDANLEMSIDKTTKKLSTDYLSQGNKDIVNLCMRLALIKGVFGDEMPFIIFDDPFERLDDKRTELCKSFVQKFAKDNQVLYFTCQEGRKC